MRLYWVLGIVFATLVIGIFWWAMAPGSGEEEFRRAQKALQSVHSWKYSEVAGDAKYARDAAWEVDCSAGWHGVVQQPDYFDEQNSARVEYSHTGNTTYMRTGDGGWVYADRYYSMDSDPSATCASLARGGSGQPFPDFNNLPNSAVITSKGTKKVNGVRCREWRVQVIKLTEQDEMNVCLSTRDHLPYEVSRDYGSRLLFSDYNKPVQIAGPK